MDKQKLIEFIQKHFSDGDIIAVSFLNNDDVRGWWEQYMGDEEVSDKRLDDFLIYLNNITYESLWDWLFIEDIASEYSEKVDIGKGEFYYEQAPAVSLGFTAKVIKIINDIIKRVIWRTKIKYER